MSAPSPARGGAAPAASPSSSLPAALPPRSGGAAAAGAPAGLLPRHVGAGTPARSPSPSVSVATSRASKGKAKGKAAAGGAKGKGKGKGKAAAKKTTKKKQPVYKPPAVRKDRGSFRPLDGVAQLDPDVPDSKAYQAMRRAGPAVGEVFIEPLSAGLDTGGVRGDDMGDSGVGVGGGVSGGGGGGGAGYMSNTGGGLVPEPEYLSWDIVARQANDGDEAADEAINGPDGLRAARLRVAHADALARYTRNAALLAEIVDRGTGAAEGASPPPAKRSRVQGGDPETAEEAQAAMVEIASSFAGVEAFAAVDAARKQALQAAAAAGSGDVAMAPASSAGAVGVAGAGAGAGAPSAPSSAAAGPAGGHNADVIAALERRKAQLQASIAADAKEHAAALDGIKTKREAYMRQARQRIPHMDAAAAARELRDMYRQMTRPLKQLNLDRR